MENFAYLYILAEENEQQAPSSNIRHRQTPVQGKKQLDTHRSTTVRTAQTVDRVKTALDCDRDSQSYPTFYL
ncbi:MAG: hypothetical protein RBJ76_08530 [Stenomitos frigidus ULC029]